MPLVGGRRRQAFDRPLKPKQSKSSLTVMETCNVLHESRLMRQVRAILATGLIEDAVIGGRWSPGWSSHESPETGVKLVRIPMMRGSRFRWLTPLREWDRKRRLLALAKSVQPSLVECHNVEGLPACARVKRRLLCPLIYTPHELETERNGLQRRIQGSQRQLEAEFVRQCDAIVCVSDSIAEWYQARYSIPRPVVVRNIPDQRLERRPGRAEDLRTRFNIPDPATIFLYQGALVPGRQIPQLIRVFRKASPDRHIVFMGYGKLASEVIEASVASPNIHHLPAVPSNEVLAHTRGADVGICGGENVCLSYYLSLPNKVFEYLHAGIPFLANDWPEFRRLADHTCSGWLVGEGDGDWSRAIHALSKDEIARGKHSANRAAPGLAWEHEREKLLDIYKGLLSSHSRSGLLKP